MKQMVVIAVAGLKGGIGKTTTATSLASLLAKENEKRVLLLDADWQGNASQLFGVYESEKAGMAEMMEALHQEEEVRLEDYIRKSDYGIDVIPANKSLLLVNASIMMSTEHEQLHLISNALKQCEEKYDVCIIDCGLQLDMTVANALIAANFVITPMRIGGFEHHGLEVLSDELFALMQFNPDLEHICLLTMFRKNKTSLNIEEYYRKLGEYDFFTTHIRDSVVVMKGSFEKPLPEYSKNSIAVKDYREVVKELLERMEVL